MFTLFPINLHARHLEPIAIVVLAVVGMYYFIRHWQGRKPLADNAIETAAAAIGVPGAQWGGLGDDPTPRPITVMHVTSNASAFGSANVGTL